MASVQPSQAERVRPSIAAAVAEPPSSPIAPPRTRRVPFLDLTRVNAPLKQEILDELGEVIDSSAFTNGRQVDAFERAFAAYCGTRSCVGVASGHDALRLGLLSAELGPGDEVIVPAMTFVATVEAVLQAGARPVLADIGEADYGLDVDAAAAAVGPRTRALLPVHLYGQMADMRALRHLAARHRLRLLEDACQAHGAVRDGLVPGETGVGAAFSFYPGKNLGAMGDAGALASNDPIVDIRMRALREHGQSAKYRHVLEGYTARLDTIQALVLLRKLPLLDAWNAERATAAAVYLAELAGVGDLQLPPVVPRSRHAWHLFVVRTRDPEALASFLGARGIHTGRHYPVPVHLAPAYAALGHRAGAFPVAEALAAEGLSLPLFPGITMSQLEHVVDAIGAYFDDGV